MSRFRIQFGMAAHNMPEEPNIEAARTRLRAQMMRAAQMVKGAWIQRAIDLKVSQSGEYIRGIAEQGEIRVISEHMGETSIEVIWEIVNTAPNARVIEDGHPAFSLAQAIDWGNTRGRIKRGKNGPFLHIPLRHHAHQSAAGRESSGMTHGALKSMMPEHIYKAALQLNPTQKRKVGPIYSASGQFQAADRYDKGDRLKHHQPAGIQLGPGKGAHNTSFEARRGERQAGRDKQGKPLVNPAWKTSKFQGMMRRIGVPLPHDSHHHPAFKGLEYPRKNGLRYSETGIHERQARLTRTPD